MGTNAMSIWQSRFFIGGMSVVGVLVAYLSGHSIGHSEGYRLGVAAELAKQAVEVTGGLLALRRSPDVNARLIDRQERTLQSILRGIAQHTSPEKLAANSLLMQGMFGVKRYRQLFPCVPDATWGWTNWPHMDPSEHAQVKAFLDALPEADGVIKRNLDQEFPQSISAHSMTNGLQVDPSP